jgi:hypothetical protein
MKRLVHCSKMAGKTAPRFVDVLGHRHDVRGMSIIPQLASDDVLDSAYAWLCRRRRAYSANSDVWSFRRGWLREKAQIKDQLLSGNYRFSLLARVTLKDSDETDLWSARDALVLKALALVLGDHLPVSRRCTHIKDNGGAKYAVRQVSEHLPANRYVLRTDVKSYYASIDHLLLLDFVGRSHQGSAGTQPFGPISAADVRARRIVLKAKPPASHRARKAAETIRSTRRRPRSEQRPRRFKPAGFPCGVLCDRSTLSPLS